MSKLLPRHTHSGVQSGSDGEVAPGFHMASVSEVCIKKIILKFNYGGLKEKKQIHHSSSACHCYKTRDNVQVESASAACPQLTCL